jgi:predicted Fe-Mo cluster-binding NifX family protein
LNIEFFSSTMNDDRIFFRIIMLILNSNNFHLWIEELKDLTLKIKIWKYINSYDKIEKSRKEVLSEIFHFLVKQSNFASSTTVDDLITNQINQSAQDFTQSRFAKYFHELSTQQQENYRASVKEYKRKEKQVAKITQRMLKIDETIRALIRTYISSKLMFVLIKEILQVLITRYKKIDDQIKKQIHEKFQALKQSSFKNQIEIWIAN